MKKISLLFFVMILALGLIMPMASVAAHTEGDPLVIDLLAGQDEDVGDITVWNDESNLYVKYVTTDPWLITETHLEVVVDPLDFPQTKKGNPIPGHFTYSRDHDYVSGWEEVIPIDEIAVGSDLYIAAHAAVVGSSEQDESAWGTGTRFVEKGNWATYFEYRVQGWSGDTVAVGNGPLGIVFDGTYIWVTNYLDDTVSKINAATGAVVDTITVGDDPYAICFDGTYIWVTNYDDDTVSKINASTGTVTATIAVGRAPIGIAFDGTYIWVANRSDATVSKINAATGAVAAPITVGNGPRGICFDSTYIWVANYDDDTVSKIDAATGNVVDTYPVGDGPYGIVFDGTNIWVSNENENTVSKIDTSDGSVVGTYPDGSPTGRTYFIFYDGTSYIWVANYDDNTVSKIDTSDGSVVNTIAVGQNPTSICFDDPYIWVTNYGDNTVSRIMD